MIPTMEFEAPVQGTRYRFSFIDARTVLATAPDKEFILYRNTRWNCADEISLPLLAAFNECLEAFKGI